MINKGMIGFSNNKVTLLGKLIRFFTNSNITHTFVITFPNANGEVMLEEASTSVQEGRFNDLYKNKSDTDYWIFKLKDGVVDEKAIDASLTVCKELLGTQYGYLQLLYFPYRWFMQTIFSKDVRHEKNWFSEGVICSELLYYYLYNLGPQFQELLKPFDADTIQAQDVMDIVVMNPTLFEFVEKNVNG